MLMALHLLWFEYPLQIRKASGSITKYMTATQVQLKKSNHTNSPTQVVQLTLPCSKYYYILLLPNVTERRQAQAPSLNT